MYNIPLNTIPYMLGALATLVVGIISTQKYKQLHTPLLRHFAISGFLACAGMALLSISFLLPISQSTLKLLLILGRACLDIVAYLQIYLIWYLTPLKKYSIWWLVSPLVLVALAGFYFQVNAYIYDFTGIINNQAVFTVPMFTTYTHAISLLIVFCAGLVLFKNAFGQSNGRSKLRLFSVGLLYVAASLSDLYNTFFLAGQGNSWIVLIGFAIASGVFLITTLFLFKRDKRNIENLSAK